MAALVDVWCTAGGLSDHIRRLAMHGAVDVSGSVGVVPNTGIIAVRGEAWVCQCSEERGRPLFQLGSSAIRPSQQP